MVCNHRLHNREAEPGAMLLGCVVGREEPPAFFRRYATAGVGNAKLHLAQERFCRKCESAAVRHGIHGIQNEIVLLALCS